MDDYQNPAIEALLASPAGEKLKQIMNTICSVQRNLSALANSEDSAQLNLLKIGTVFQIFLIDTLASGKSPKELTKDDWLDIAKKVSQYAILEEDQCYSAFVFTLYANYIDISAESIRGIAPKESIDSIKALASAIRDNGEKLQSNQISESAYVESCLWLSLEAMIKLLSSSLTPIIGVEYTQLAQAVSQLAFEYGRYVLYAKEQAILEAYIQNQHVLDEQLQAQYESFLAEIQKNASQFQSLLDNAFSPDLPNLLMRSAELARAAGVPEDEILKSVDDVDAFFIE